MVAERLGFANRAFQSAAASSPLADYAVTGIGSPAASTAVAGASGTVVAFVLAYVLARLLVPRGARDPGSRAGGVHGRAPRPV
jgi:hypothetical protein